jgi:hypothetical protein
MPPITDGPSLFASSYSPHPSTFLAESLPSQCDREGQWSGLPRSLSRINSPFRLRLSPDSVCSTASLCMTEMTCCNACLAGADNCRRPDNPNEGSVDDSHMLAMRVGSLAPALPCNSVVLHVPLPACAVLREGHC